MMSGSLYAISFTGNISLDARCSMGDAIFDRQVFPGDKCLSFAMKRFCRVLPNWALTFLGRDLLWRSSPFSGLGLQLESPYA